MKLNINGKEVEISNDDLSKAIEEKKDTFEVKLDGVTIRTEEEETAFKSNTENDARTAGIEIGRKNVLKGLTIEVDGAHKSDDKAISAINTFVSGKVQTGLKDAKIEPDKRVKELEESNAVLVSNNANLQGDFDAFKQQSVVKDQNHQRLDALGKHIPKNSINSRDNTLILMSSGIKTGFNEEGVMFGIGTDGKPMKDPKTQNLLPIESVVTGFFESNPSLLAKANGGAGGGDSGNGGSKQTLDEFIEEQHKADVHPNSEEFNKTMADRQKAGTLEV